MLRKVLNKRLCPVRYFSKDTDHLKKQFQQMAKEHQQRLKEQSKTSEEEIKAKDQTKVTEELKSKFKGLQGDLSKQSGEAKSAYEQWKESYKNFSMPKFSMPNISSWKKSYESKKEPKETQEGPKEEPSASETSTSENTSKADPSETDTPETESSETQQKEAKPTWSETYPRFSPVFNFTHKTSSYVVESLKETFPTSDYKMQKLIKIQEKIKKDREILEKMERGEELGEDEQIPEWKKGALEVVPEKLSRWQRVKRRVQESSFGSSFSSRFRTVTEHESYKKAQENWTEFKEGVSNVKENVKEELDSSENKVYHKSKEYITEAMMETDTAKAVKIMRMYDPEFDIYALESELEYIFPIFYSRYLSDDLDYIKKICEGQALKYFSEKIKERVQTGEIRKVTTPLEVTRPSFLGVNLDDKTNPKFSYGLSINERVDTFKDQEDAKGSARGKFKKSTLRANYFLTVTRNTDTDWIEVGHPWKISVFYASERKLHLT